ncbi:tyrosine-type recombinase/integrase [Corynebacterium sp. AOP12-C2-36]|uniref:tyrosine-type recombinase/integrase n=1 Tax=Corynebacterium sp. AOP12-C2-36 TaxID=3457723 RepID=UPI004034A692
MVRYPDAEGVERSESFPRRDLAVARQAEIITHGVTGAEAGPEDAGNITLGETVAQWAACGPRQSTRDNRNRLLADLGELHDVAVGELTQAAVQEWAQQLTAGRPWRDGRPLAATTASKRVSQLRGILLGYVEDGVLERNPVTRVRVRSKGLRRVTAREVPAERHIELFLRHAPAWLSLAIRVAVTTGLRAGEVAGLRGTDVDVANCQIMVSRQCTHRRGEPLELKSVASNRTVPVPASLAAELAAAGTGWAIAGAEGFGVSSRIIGAQVARTRRSAGISEKVSFHGFRHYYASAMLADHVPLPMVSALLGHETTATTSRVYAHWLPGQMEMAAAAAESLGAGLAVPDIAA